MQHLRSAPAAVLRWHLEWIQHASAAAGANGLGRLGSNWLKEMTRSLVKANQASTLAGLESSFSTSLSADFGKSHDSSRRGLGRRLGVRCVAVWLATVAAAGMAVAIFTELQL